MLRRLAERPRVAVAQAILALTLLVLAGLAGAMLAGGDEAHTAETVAELERSRADADDARRATRVAGRRLERVEDLMAAERRRSARRLRRGRALRRELTRVRRPRTRESTRVRRARSRESTRVRRARTRARRR